METLGKSRRREKTQRDEVALPPCQKKHLIYLSCPFLFPSPSFFFCILCVTTQISGIQFGKFKSFSHKNDFLKCFSKLFHIRNASLLCTKHNEENEENLLSLSLSIFIHGFSFVVMTQSDPDSFRLLRLDCFTASRKLLQTSQIH